MANGDITLSSPLVRTTNTLQFVQAVIATNSIEVIFQESVTGTVHRVFITNTSCIGVDYAGGVFTDNVNRAVSGELTKLFGLVLKTGALTTLIQTLQTDGILTIAGSVG